MVAHGTSHVTTDHQEIRQWVERRGGRPATVRGTEQGSEEAGVLRIDFPEQRADDAQLEEISWDEFFEKFDEEELAMVLQETTANGQPSYFNKIVSRDKAEQSKNR